VVIGNFSAAKELTRMTSGLLRCERWRRFMSNTETFFEQIPVETVKKIFREKVRRTKKENQSEDVTVQPPAAGADLPSSERPAS
jgi:hypothetical protein